MVLKTSRKFFKYNASVSRYIIVHDSASGKCFNFNTCCYSMDCDSDNINIATRVSAWFPLVSL